MTKTMQTFKERSERSQNSILKKLYQIIEEKKTNLCISLDLTTKAEILNLVKIVGPHICIVKDFDCQFIEDLKNLSKELNFLIFEDRKFADIVKHQFSQGIYKISSWADIINCHILPGEGIIQGLRAVSNENLKESGLLIIYEMSSNSNIFNKDYKSFCLEWAEKYKDYIIGFISGHKPSTQSDFITMTPGISLEQVGDSLGQNYTSPDNAILSNDSDVIIVGRSIIHSKDPLKSAILYKKAGWNAYLTKIKQY